MEVLGLIPAVVALKAVVATVEVLVAEEETASGNRPSFTPSGKKTT